MARRALTEPQARVLEYLVNGEQLFTQRELAEAVGLDHPQKVVAAVMGLLMKGYLIVDPDYIEELLTEGPEV